MPNRSNEFVEGNHSLLTNFYTAYNVNFCLDSMDCTNMGDDIYGQNHSLITSAPCTQFVCNSNEK